VVDDLPVEVQSVLIASCIAGPLAPIVWAASLLWWLFH